MSDTQLRNVGTQFEQRIKENGREQIVTYEVIGIVPDGHGGMTELLRVVKRVSEDGGRRGPTTLK